MKKHLILLFLFVFTFTICNGQKLVKVKGNKIVQIVNTTIAPFHTIDLDENFEIDIIYNETPSVEIETDENLHEFIKFQVTDSVLTFDRTRKITSKKKLYIKVNYTNIIRNIIISQDAKITGLIPVEFADNSTLKTSGSSKAALTVRTKNFNFEGSEKSKVKLNILSESSVVSLSGNSKIEALITTKKLDAYLLQRSNAIIEGNCDDLSLELDNNTLFNGKNFTTKTCNVSCDISSNAYLEVLESVTMSASGNSSIYLYQNPKITIDNFTGTAKLQMKESSK